MIQQVAATQALPPMVASPVVEAARAPLGALQARLDAHVWGAVARDASNHAAQQVAVAMLAAMQGGVPVPQALAGAGAVAAGVPGMPGAPAATLAMQALPAEPATTATVAATPAGASPQAVEVVRLVNEARAAKGLAPVALDAKLVQVAAGHSQHMAAKQRMAHEGIGNGTPHERIVAARPGVRRTAENVAMGQQTPAEVMQGWMDSPGHRKNILDPKLTHVGVDVATGPDGRPYWTQVFTG